MGHLEWSYLWTEVEWWMSGAGGRRERKVLSVGHIYQGCVKAQEMGGGDGCTTL